MTKEEKEKELVEEKPTPDVKPETKSSKEAVSKVSEKKKTTEDKVDTTPKKVEAEKKEDIAEKQKDSLVQTETVDDKKQIVENKISEAAVCSSIDLLPVNSREEIKFAVRGKDYKLHIYDNRLGTQIKTVAFGAVTAVINKDEPCNKVLVYADPSCSKESILGWANISDLVAL